MMSSELWQVVGGGAKGGILVRKEADTTSVELNERLSTGSIVKQIALVQGRLHYELVTGEGPQTGWVSMTFKDKDLLVKHGDKTSEKNTSDSLFSLVSPPDVYRLVYYETPTRAEQVRLLFRMTGTAFDNVKIKDFPQGLDPYRPGALGDASPVPFDQAPILQHNGLTIAETPAIMQYVAEKVGLVEDTPEARARAMMFMVASEEMRDHVFYPNFNKILAVFEAGNKAGTPQQEIFQNVIELKPGFLGGAPYDKWMGHFERHLRCHSEPSGGPFLWGPKLCYADVAVYDCATAIWTLPICEPLKERKRKFPLLVALVKAVRDYPKLKEHLDIRGDFWPAISKVWNGEALPE